MSYLALARKWRPRRFEDVRGQDHVVRALSHALDRDQLHPAILLTGTRGVGKTTLARLIAKGLNCETGVSSKPCGVCSACREVSEGRFVDLLEIDAASNTGVDNVRELIDNAQYSPARGRYKVYLIDEVHMLSKPAFNALLKTLEEPPSHVKFILATTDPQKLLPTVLSRCLQFNLKRLPLALLRETFADILGQENVAFEPAALAEIARAADGSMRDGLSLLDQAIAFAGGGSLSRALVEDMLGTVGRRTLLELIGALAAGDGALLLEGLRKLEESGPDYAALLSALAGSLQRIAVLQLLPQAADADDDPQLLEFARAISAEDLQLNYQIAVLGRRDLSFAPDPRLGFEMTRLRMFAFRADGGSSTPTATGADNAPPRSASPTAASGATSAAASSASQAAASVSVAASAAPSPAPMLSTPRQAASAPLKSESGLHRSLAVDGINVASTLANSASASTSASTPSLSSHSASTHESSRMSSPMSSASTPVATVAGAERSAAAPTPRTAGVASAPPPRSAGAQASAKAPSAAYDAAVGSVINKAGANVASMPANSGGTAIPATKSGAPVAAASSANGDVDDPWALRIESLGLDGMSRQLARHCAWLGEADGLARLALDTRARHLLNDDRRAVLAAALSKSMGTNLQLSIEIGVEGAGLSPAAREEQRLIERQRAAEQAIENDPVVRMMKDSFGATVRPGSIRPLD